MDSLNKTLNNLSLYEVKHYVRKAQNAVLNLSEVESKVREATNNEPWGASSSLMSEIARGTFNYKDREEISNLIFRRFTEKSSHEWRQIYKALQLMEYLVKHGSERFVDDARANVSLVSMLKSFHYIDSKGVDQGINVRNRARELASLLNDEAQIRQERRKAKENAKKFGAISSGGGRRGGSSRHGNDIGGSVGASRVALSVGEDGFERRIFGDGGVYGQRYGDTAANHKGKITKYEEYDLESERPTRKGSKPTVSAPVDLVSFDGSRTAYADEDDNHHDENHHDENHDDDDEFDDFQSATPAPAAQTTSLADLFNAPYQQSSTQSQAIFTQPHATKKNDDVFGSLLASAKAGKAAKTTPAMPTNTGSVSRRSTESFTALRTMTLNKSANISTSALPGSINCRNDDNMSKLLFGIYFSLRKISNYLTEDSGTTFKSSTLNNHNKVTNFTTLNYKCHIFETLTGLKFLVVTDMRCRDLNIELASLFNTIYLQKVIENQACAVDFRPGEYIDNEPFIEGVDKYWSSLIEFSK
ncbi:hypothetical protein FOA43_004456 [Brettanomyces nanus]|uniref:ENTH domain-containing protein n=1 Tax=Eeniella nana TaxID=13502 RepID=A0A875S7Y8_EENNA|nr:uncharacterized protein FOA43_004456 [Brettanomyces nanus]QPG77058.1 hypothetical protein FOA43_004456 [Brettanomyces nanus]